MLLIWRRNKLDEIFDGVLKTKSQPEKIIILFSLKNKKSAKK